jgi:geranylgeranyl pyrophosphate synthase
MMADLQTENDQLKHLLQLIHDDLLMRSETENGISVVNLSNFIWNNIKEVLGNKND